MEWVKKKDVVVIFPITNEGKVVLIKSYRVPLEKYVIELPAGLVDRKGESLEDVARRELMEETGYHAGKFLALPPTPYAAGTSNNLTNNFIATDLSKSSEVHGDVTEDISIIEVPLNDLVTYYLNSTDVLFNLKIIALQQVALAKGFPQRINKKRYTEA